MEIPIVAGRDISKFDGASSPKVALVNERFVHEWLGGADPIGARLRTIAEPGYPEATYEIIGVVRDAKYGNLRTEVPPIAYAPAPQVPTSGTYGTIVLRSSAPLGGITTAIRERFSKLDPSMRMGASVLKTQIRDGLARERLLAWLSGFFGVLAVVLVLVGLYGLVSYTTLLRKNELGVRLALGAQRRNILWLVLRQGLQLSVVGVGVGLAGAIGLTRLLGSLLFDVKTTDLVTWIATPLFLVLVAAVACWIPARRAARSDPMEALRYE
jgi:hypothetical protein